jgi:hypothetical protein
MEERKDTGRTDFDERLDGNEMEERKDVDTRRWEVEDDNGHLVGSRQANSNEQDTEEQRKQEDTNEYNQLDDRATASGTESV